MLRILILMIQQIVYDGSAKAEEYKSCWYKDTEWTYKSLEIQHCGLAGKPQTSGSTLTAIEERLKQALCGVYL